MLASLASRSRSGPSGRAVLAVASMQSAASRWLECSQNLDSVSGFAGASPRTPGPQDPGSDRDPSQCSLDAPSLNVSSSPGRVKSH